MKILISGATGLIGTSAADALAQAGHSVVCLRRDRSGGGTWDPRAGRIDAASISGADALLHLAGANIGEKRWTKSRKQLIRDSRVGPTTALANFLASLDSPPSTIIVASAIGYYGNRGDEWLDESSPNGQGFLAEVVRQWEGATRPAAEKGIRVVNLRFGVILTPTGGALKRMLLPFKIGVGGPMGDGRQYWSWVSLEDVVGAIRHVLLNSSLSGPVNVVSPHPVTNREFSKTLGQVLRRPSFMPLPALAARLALGEMANELLLYSARVKPAKLQETGYQFRDPSLDKCLQRLLHHE